MKSPSWILNGVIAGLVLGAIALYTGIPFRSHNALAADEVTDVVTLMLTSHQNWDTIQGTAEITYYVHNGSETQTYLDTFAYGADGRGYADLVEHTTGQPVHSFTFVADGATLYFVDWVRQEFRRQAQPDFREIFERLPTRLTDVATAEDGTQRIVFHPMAQYGHDPLMDYLFPTGMAQRGEYYSLVGTEQLLGRDVYVLDFSFEPGDQPNARYWVDAATGVMLQVRNYSAERKGELLDEIRLTSFRVDAPIDALIQAPDTAELAETGLLPQRAD